ncbi:hypothetical protein BZG36_01095 [Bifiguratus adelaidae]|uniref:Protein FAM32A n=1 Tax=Bifiguratus adelaidae TaxID=1938954 RepID=A0A261Y602_9FUNG|nr:hypothetical protein BZG36_01095 [Bifiguratus adelaidae]
MSAYESVTKGALKLKGGDPIVKKKKKKTKSEHVSTKSDSSSSTTTDKKPKKTAAELKFEEAQRLRQEERIRKQAAMSHKDRVADFNRRLEELSEHYDIPKVGPG